MMKLTALPALLICVSAAQAATYTFQTINNPADTTFNQLLGITNGGVIVGYYGATINKGYTVAPPYGAGNFTNENFPGSDQTQVVGINNNASSVTVGFYITGVATNGFVDQGGTFTNVTNPLSGAAGQNQLLGINNSGVAVGFYTDAAGNNQGYSYNVASKTFTPVALPGSFNAVMTTAAGINNAGVVVGFYTDAGGNVHSFIDQGGAFTTLDAPGGANTMLTGVNNNGQAVGSFVDGTGKTDGVLYNSLTKSWLRINDPNDSANAAFNVTGTTINGINDNGQLVGFYSDGANVNGFLASSTVPEPTTAGLLGLAGLALVVVRRRIR
jgi:hypothetical protein